MTTLMEEAISKVALDQLSFRQYRRSDLARCSEILLTAWPELKYGGLDVASVEWYGWPSTWRELACVSDRVVGILFGRIDCDLGRLGGMRIWFDHAIVYLKLLLGVYGKMENRTSFIRSGLKDDSERAEGSPESDAEVTLFVIDTEYRGKGIGRAMMERFIDEARGKGAKTVSVCTNEPGSNHAFYEGYGFKRFSTFSDSFMSMVRKETVKSITYTLDVLEDIDGRQGD